MNPHSHTHTHASGLQTEGATIHWARFYDTVVKLMALGQDKAMRQETAEQAELKPGQSVLDVGCGTGDLTLLASRRVGPTGRVYGIDAAPEMIAVAQRKARKARAGAVFQTEAIEQLSFPDKTFDVVLSSLMMHHLPGDLKLRGLVEVRRVLKPGGRVFIADFCQPSGQAPWLLRLAAMHMSSPASTQGLIDIVREAGFTDVRSRDSRLGVIAFVSGCAPVE